MEAMATKIDTIPPRLLVRRCMSCGYDGPAIRAPHATHCALCNCDLIIRPPRSYAELEGFVAAPPMIESSPPVGFDPRRARMLQRWVAFLFFAGAAMVTLTYLLLAAMTI
jgi:hypothetical protein